MRISDWSSDVCSSDLRRRHGPLVRLFDWLTTLPPDEAARHRGDILATAMLSPFALLTSSLGILMMSLLAMLFTQAPWATVWSSDERRVGEEGVRKCRSRWSR